MQQTNKYKLNLVEKTDAFSPDPLNDNAQKLESALTEAERARTATNNSLNSTKTDLNATKSDLNSTKSKLSTVESNLAKAKTDLTNAVNAAKAEAKSGDQAEANARANAVNALANRLTTLEGRKFVAGYSTTSPHMLGFTPKAVLISADSGSMALATPENNYSSVIVNGGFDHSFSPFYRCSFIAVL